MLEPMGFVIAFAFVLYATCVVMLAMGGER